MTTDDTGPGRGATYYAGIEVLPRPGSQMWGRARGGFLYAFATGGGSAEAEARIRASLDSSHYEIKEMEFIQLYEHVEWSTPAEQSEYDQYADQAARSGEVVYGPFFTYETD